jgi:hypothetical protein
MNFENIISNLKRYFKKERNIVKFIASFSMVFSLMIIGAIACVLVYAADITPSNDTHAEIFSDSSSEIAITSGITKVTTSITTTTVSTTIVTESSSIKVTTTKKAEVKKTVEQLAKEVIINGKWGNGEDRKENLKKAGYNPEKVQDKINEMLYGNEYPNDVTSDSNDNDNYTDDNATDSITESYSNDDNDDNNEDTYSSSVNVSTGGTTYVTTFTKGTCYAYGYQCVGGSGRSLIDCSWGDGTVHGSVASSFIYNNFGYNVNGRTMVYLEVNGCPSMSGYYYVDDCNSFNHPEIIDFYFNDYYNCDWYYQGVIYSIDCYLVN